MLRSFKVAAVAMLILALFGQAKAFAETSVPAVGADEFMVELPVTQSGDASQVTLDVAGASLTVLFQLTGDGNVSIVGVTGMPVGSVAELNGDQLEVKFVDGTEVEATLGQPTLDEQGAPTSVPAQVQVAVRDEDDEDTADDDTEDTGDDSEDTGADTGGDTGEDSDT